MFLLNEYIYNIEVEPKIEQWTIRLVLYVLKHPKYPNSLLANKQIVTQVEYSSSPPPIHPQHITKIFST